MGPIKRAIWSTLPARWRLIGIRMTAGRLKRRVIEHYQALLAEDVDHDQAVFLMRFWLLNNDVDEQTVDLVEALIREERWREIQRGR